MNILPANRNVFGIMIITPAEYAKWEESTQQLFFRSLSGTKMLDGVGVYPCLLNLFMRIKEDYHFDCRIKLSASFAMYFFPLFHTQWQKCMSVEQPTKHVNISSFCVFFFFISFSAPFSPSCWKKQQFYQKCLLSFWCRSHSLSVAEATHFFYTPGTKSVHRWCCCRARRQFIIPMQFLE